MTKTEALNYSGNYTPYSRTEILAEVEKRISKKRFKHVLRVEETAIALAEQYEVDAEKVSIASLLHDIAKEEEDNEMMDFVISENLNLDLLQYGSAIWHAPIAMILAERDFHVEDEEILLAIKHHTLAAPQMSLVEQVVFIADYIEPGRDFEGVEKARELAKISLEQAVRFAIEETLIELVRKNRKIYPKAIDSYNAWVAN